MCVCLCIHAFMIMCAYVCMCVQSHSKVGPGSFYHLPSRIIIANNLSKKLQVLENIRK